MKRLLFVMLLALTGVSGANAPLADISALLAKPRLMCGHFEQEKQLVGIKKPLVSEGRFCVEVNKAITWDTQRPFANTLQVTPDKIIQAHEGQVTSELDARQEPVVRMINNVLFSLLAGDLSQLDKVFLIQGSIKNGTWSVLLKARDASLEAAIGTIHLQGDQFVKKVILQEQEGDRTTIVFSAMVTGAKAANLLAKLPRLS